ncbi:MAG: outer membrane protein assembly factor BamA [Candidatus Cloacimonetes bacterium]|nr:outer membrane protein assembly factor BamA [Candidatus Cloacimonadota bacterium]
MKIRILLILVFFILFSVCFAAQDYEYITGISVFGNINVSTKLIESTSGLAPGDIYFAENVSNAIGNIYKLGLFEKIDINKIDSEKGVEIIIKVVEYPIIQEVLITGNKKIKNEAIRTEINIGRGDYWSDQRKFETRNRILSLYYDKGYRLASVSFDEQQFQSNKIGLAIIINEGQKVTIKEIIFIGNNQIKDKKLRKVLKTKTRGFLRSGEFNLEKFEEDIQRIKDYYHARGFIDATVVDWKSEYDDEGNLILEIEIYEGNQYKIGFVTVEGNYRFSDEIILNQLKIKPDEIFDQEEFNNKLNLVHSLYYEEGYIYSAIIQDIQRVGEYINIIVNITENTRARVRQIYIKGNKKTKEKVIRRQLAIIPGDYFRQSLLMQSQRNIYNLGFFEPNVGLDYKPINDEGDIDLIFLVEDKESGTANGGVSFDQRDKFVGFISLAHNNVFGNAWRIGIQWEFSGIKQNYDISFTNPYLFDTNTLLGFDVYHTKRRWEDWNYIIYRTGGGIRVGTMIPWIDYSRVTCGYSLTQKKYEILNPKDEISDDLRELVDKGSKFTSNIFVTLERDGRDNVFRPSSGALIRLFTELAGGPIGGSENYYKEIIQTNWYLKLFWKLALGMKWRFGYVKEFGESDNVPPDERFYPGGTGPDGIRGYIDRSVVPSLGGGKAELICSSEITFPISGDQIIGVLFLDAGNSYNYLSEMNVQGLKKGAGIGVRIMTPMGLLGFDYAYGFDRETKSKWQTHFQFGTTF